MVPSDDSSMIDQVLTHRGGTRLTLSLLVMEVARRLDLSLKPVQLPGCLLLALDLEGVELAGWVEPRRFLWLWLDELKQSYLDSHQMSQALCVVR
ncbi:transglutaminase-like superfamily, partial [Haematococcus lacustris]